MNRFTTVTEYEIQSHYTGHGWEMATTEIDRKEAFERLKEYRENEPHISHRLRRVYVPVPRVPVWLHFTTDRLDCLQTLQSVRIGSRALVNSRWRTIKDGAVDMGKGNGTCRVNDQKEGEL